MILYTFSSGHWQVFAILKSPFWQAHGLGNCMSLGKHFRSILLVLFCDIMVMHLCLQYQKTGVKLRRVLGQVVFCVIEEVLHNVYDQL